MGTLTLMISFPVSAYNSCNNQIKIAIIDTGLDLSDSRFLGHICNNGHKNFVNDETLKDINGHGTFVAGLIQRYAGDSNYCMLIYKFYQDSAGITNQNREVLAIKEAIKNGAKIINISAGGEDFSEDESLAIRDNPNVTFVVSAGNDDKNLDVYGNVFYPASLFYPNMEVVGSIDSNGNKSSYSNYSKRIKDKEMGDNVKSYLPNNKEDTGSGTSFSTAIFSGKLLAKNKNSCEYR